MSKIILLNGPPSSGKDTAAKHIRQMVLRSTFPQISVCILDRMSMPIKRAFAGTMNLPIDADGNVDYWEAHKEEIVPQFGVSYRQWQIDFSERFMKPIFDEAIFGVLLSARIKRRFEKKIADLLVIPDCGFQVEIATLYHYFNPDDILLIRPHRNGFTFSGDSRSYVRAPSGAAVFDPINSLPEEYEKQIEAGVRCWLETPERMRREE